MKRAWFYVIPGVILATLGGIYAAKFKKKHKTEDGDDLKGMTADEILAYAREMEGEASEPAPDSSNSDEMPTLFIEDDELRVELDTNGTTNYYEDGRLVKTKEAKWWPNDGKNYRIMAITTRADDKAWLLFFETKRESHFCTCDIKIERGHEYLKPDYILAMNSRMELIPICARTEAMCTHNDRRSELANSATNYGKHGWVKVTNFVNTNTSVDVVSVAFFDPTEDVLIVCDALNSQSIARPLKCSDMKYAYVGDAIVYDKGEEGYGYLRLGSPNTTYAPATLTDVFGSHNFARFCRICESGDIMSSPFYDVR